MELEFSYESEEDIPEGFGDLFTEKGGKFELTGVRGVKTQADVDRLQEGLRKERETTKKVKQDLDRYVMLGGLDEIQERLHRLEDLEETGKNGKPDALAQKVRTLDRQVQQITQERDHLRKERDDLRTEQKRATIVAEIQKAGRKVNLLPEAVDDAEMRGASVMEITEEGTVRTRDGLTPAEWFEHIKPVKPHWFQGGQGSGARGSRAPVGEIPNNPWSKGNWNRTEQVKFKREHGVERAKAAASAAGSQLDATKPPE